MLPGRNRREVEENIRTQGESKEFDEQWRERKKTGGGKVPASPNAISKLVADVIPASGQQPCD